jgi:long-chain fatty acid transport protein
MNYWVMAALVLGTTASVWANGFRNPPESASALGRSGGKVAQIDDASAVAINPANIVDLSKPEFVASLTLIHSETEFDSALGGSSETEDPVKYLPNVFATMPMGEGRYTLGVGITTPFGQSTTWESDTPFKYSIADVANLRVVNVNPTVATKINEKLSIGAGVDLFWSDLEFRQLMPWSAIVGAPVPDGHAHITGDGYGFGGNAGLTYVVAKGHRVALTYRSPVKVEYEGDFEVNNVPAPGVLAPKSDFESDIEFPSIVALGYGVEMSPDLCVEADVEWIQFSTFDALPLDLGANNAAGIFPPEIPQAWDDTWTFGLGADWRAAKNLILRAGWVYLESPIPEETLSPSLPDADRHVFSVGAGYARNGHAVDIGYALSMYDRGVDKNLVPSVLGDYDTTTHLLAVSYGRSF